MYNLLKVQASKTTQVGQRVVKALVSIEFVHVHMMDCYLQNVKSCNNNQPLFKNTTKQNHGSEAGINLNLKKHLFFITTATLRLGIALYLLKGTSKNFQKQNSILSTLEK